MESLLFLLSLDVEDNSLEFSLLSWLFNTENSSSITDISSQHICRQEDNLNILDIHEIPGPVQENLFKADEDPELPCFDMLPENNIDQLVVHETSQITNVRESAFLNELSESINKSDSEYENNQESEPLYPVAQGIEFKTWKELDE
ncbi:23685_t:CDS:1, partial [Gigaspora margarita]